MTFSAGPDNLIWLENTKLRSHPLERRKLILQNLFGSCDPVRYCDHVARRGKAFYAMVREAGLEGMVAKRRRVVLPWRSYRRLAEREVPRSP